MKTEFIWSDGHRSKFKNKYMVHLLQSLSAKHNMKIENIELYSYITREKCSTWYWRKCGTTCAVPLNE